MFEGGQSLRTREGEPDEWIEEERCGDLDRAHPHRQQGNLVFSVTIQIRAVSVTYVTGA
jgi:hypothetical protein